jgi:hypothetical protein
MRLRSPLITLGLALALATSAAASAATHGGSLSGSRGAHARATHKAHTATPRISTSRARSSGVIYIHVPAVANPAPYVDPNECQDTGSNCTAEQACEYWGECATSYGQATDPTATEPTATTGTAGG